MNRIANYCPLCGAKTISRFVNGRERPVCPQCDHIIYFDPKVAVLVFIVENKKILLIKRALDPGKGCWACPAGFVDYDESPEEAARREVLEETGLRVAIDRLLDVFPKKDDGLADIVICYTARVMGGDLKAADDAEEVGWFTKENLPELVFYPSIALAQRWVRGEL